MKEIKSTHYLKKFAQYRSTLRNQDTEFDDTESRYNDQGGDGSSIFDNNQYDDNPDEIVETKGQLGNEMNAPIESEFAEEGIGLEPEQSLNDNPVGMEDESFEGHGYTVDDLNRDHPGVVDRIVEYLKSNPNSENLAVAQMFEAAPAHISEIGQKNNIPVKTTAKRKNIVIKGGSKKRNK